MAENSKRDGIPSNDEVVDQLTEDLQDSCIVSEEKSDTESMFEDAEGDIDSSKEVLKEDKKASDFIDEEELKEKEQTYSEEDRLASRKESEKIKSEGNDHFKAGNYSEAAEKYTLSLRTCSLAFPKDRAILFANRAAAKIKMDLNAEAIEDCTKAITLNPEYVKAYIRRAQTYEETEKLDEALEDFKKILELDPSNKDAYIATQRLPPLINERNEKLKTEMLGKLKDLGNMILKPFGLSTNNFQMVQDPNTGSYSVSYKQS